MTKIKTVNTQNIDIGLPQQLDCLTSRKLLLKTSK